MLELIIPWLIPVCAGFFTVAGMLFATALIFAGKPKVTQ